MDSAENGYPVEDVLSRMGKVLDLVEIAEMCMAFVHAGAARDSTPENLDPLVGDLFDAAALYVAKYDVECMGNPKGNPKGSPKEGENGSN